MNDSRSLCDFLLPVGLLIALALPIPVSASAPPALRVSENGRFLVTSDGKPFFWLGDTAWRFIERASRVDRDNQPSAQRYFEKRAAQGFNVCQTVLVHPDSKTNAAGHAPFLDADFARPRVLPGSDNDFWDDVDWFVDQAANHGMYLALLPVWNDLVPTNHPMVKNPAIAYRYGHFLGARYAGRTHLIWVLGGDAAPARDVGVPERLTMIRAMAEGLADGVNGEDRQDGRADWSSTLMTYHPRGGGQSSSKHLHAEPWLDFNMIQTTTKFEFANYQTVAADYALTPAKPTLDAEVAYEGSLSLWKTEPQERRIAPWDVRRAAYWNVFAGGFGFTYGHRSFIAWTRQGETNRWGAHIPWFKSLDAPGANQMRHLRTLMESHPMRVPGQSLLSGDAGSGGDHLRATRTRQDRSALVYSPMGKEITVRMDKLAAIVNAGWFDPRTGASTPIGVFEARGTQTFTPPSSGEDHDWVLVLESGDKLPAVSQLPLHPELSDALVMLNGRRVTTREQWFNERRPELIRLFQHYMFGQLPPKPVAVSGKVERVDATAFGGKATLSEVTLAFGPTGPPPIHLMLVVPNRRAAPAPVVLALNYFGNHTLVHDQNVRLPDNWMPQWGGEGAWSAKVVGNRATEAGRGSWAKFWPIEDLLERGYALATFYNGDIDPDTPDQRGLQKFYRQPDPADDCGTIGAWAWGLQRAVDYLVTAPGIDARRIVVTGHSRTGKAALLAAAFDERIALAIPHQAGCGGSAPSRARIAIGKRYNTLDTPQTKPPETVANINDKFPHWFNARFKEFNAQPERLPFDQHCLVALCASRPVLFTNGRADTWINPAGQFEVLRAAAPVYRLLGAGDFAMEELPLDGRLNDGVLGYYLRPGAHSLLREDWKVFLDFADKHLGRP
ncbi:MAG: DUF4038 domain-containing protein [Verrucomicrobia bacterium]|nr:DUF4038 domain-containing protein [Verrucomicrobiota bacterium]